MQFKHNNNEWVDLSSPLLIDQMSPDVPVVAEHRLTLSFPFGDAELTEIMMPNIHMVYGDLLLRTNKLRIRTNDIPDLIEMHFSLDGPGSMTNYLDGRQHTFGPNEHNLVYVPNFDGYGFYDPHKRRKFFEIHILASHFVELVKGAGPLLENFAEKVANKEYVDLGKHNLPITLAMHQCIRDIMQCSCTGGLKYMYLHSKVIEILTMQTMAFQQAADAPATSVLKSPQDKDSILYAREYLLQHIDMPPSLTELAAIAGTNEFKLKKGFKEMFNNTVFGYLSDVKLTQARDLLQKGLSIKNVADQLGYSSVQHFGTAFKKKFGIPPGKL